jgi:hypothetical protein
LEQGHNIRKPNCPKSKYHPQLFKIGFGHFGILGMSVSGILVSNNFGWNILVFISSTDTYKISVFKFTSADSHCYKLNKSLKSTIETSYPEYLIETYYAL